MVSGVHAPALESETNKVGVVMHAVIETGGKQYRVSAGDTLYIEKLPSEAGDEVTFDRVLAIIDGETTNFGAPLIKGATVTAEVVKNGKQKKVIVYKMKPKKNYRRKQGHRQPYTQVKINQITV